MTFSIPDDYDALCLFIYEVCNDCQFGHLSGSDFVNFMNLKPTVQPASVRPKENLRICYMAMMCARRARQKRTGNTANPLTTPSKKPGS